MLVYGDTNSTLAGALAAAKLRVPVAHVEAGLRSFDRTMPEELNRDPRRPRVEPALLPHRDRRRRTSPHEGITRGRPRRRRRHARREPPPRADRARAVGGARARPASSRARYVLVTVHREANIAAEPALGRIVEALNALDEPVVFPAPPAHARGAIEATASRLAGHVHPRPPAGYLDFAALASQARVVLTDSGGVQKEAYWYGVPCVTLRTTTEWVETVEAGWNRLVGTDPGAIVAGGRARLRPGPSSRPSTGTATRPIGSLTLLCTMEHA